MAEHDQERSTDHPTVPEEFDANGSASRGARPREERPSRPAVGALGELMSIRLPRRRRAFQPFTPKIQVADGYSVEDQVSRDRE